jgi:hypothetical protein
MLAVLWAPPFIEECVQPRGNITILLHHFEHPPEPTTGFRKGASLSFQHLDVWSFARRAFRSPGAFRDTLSEPTSAGIGALVLLSWLASVWVARKYDRTLIQLHATVAATLPLALVAESRIIGIPYAHVIFFARCTGAFVLMSVLLTVEGRLSSRISPRAAVSVRAAGVLFTLGCVLRLMTEQNDGGSKVSFPGRQLRALAVDTVQSLRRRERMMADVGPYMITWHDVFYGGAQGYGLLIELERSGIHAFVADNGFNRALVGPHRVLDPKKATATLDVVNGAWLPELAGKPGTAVLALSDPRTPSEREAYARVVMWLAGRLHRIGKPEVVPQIERSFHALAVSGLSPEEVLVAGQLARLGAPGAVLLYSKR